MKFVFSRRGDIAPHWPGVFWPGAVIAFALAFSFAAGPFRSPDEPNHFFRAYEISEGHLFAARSGVEFVGDHLPASLAEVAKTVSAFPDVPPIRTSRAAISAALRMELNSGNRVFLHFPGAALHSPLVYFPAAMGIAIGRLSHAGPLCLLYLARCFNAISAGGLIGFALKRISFRAPFLATIALFPMCLFQVGTLTADALTFGICFVWYAEILHARSRSHPDRPPRYRWILLAAALSQLRFPYPLLGLLVLTVPDNLFGDMRAGRFRFLLGFFAALILPCLGWLGMVQRLQVQMRPLVEVDPARQLQFVVTHPFHFFQMIGSGLGELGLQYWHQAVGMLGWLDFPVRSWILFGITVSLVATICTSDVKGLRLTMAFRMFSFALAATGLLLTALIVYLAWNVVGAPRIEGWQGRYAIPLLPLVALAAANKWLYHVQWISYCAVAFPLLANVVVIIDLARATYF
jgi:uncharacterized membrane protein